MSFQAMTWAVKQVVGNATGKAVLLMLANYADAEGKCFPSQDTLSKDCECAVRSVARWLVILERQGLIRRDHRRRDDGYRTSDAIFLNFSHDTVSHDLKSHDGLSPDTVSILTGHKVIARTSKVNRKIDITPREELEKVLDPVRAKAVIDHRQKIRKGLTAHAAALLAGKFSKCPDPNAAADAMIANGWQGFNPEWLEPRQARGSPGRRENVSDVANRLIKEMDDAEPPGLLEIDYQTRQRLPSPDQR